MADLIDINIYSTEGTNGAVGAGWKLYTYVYGTSTAQATYPTEADADALTNANTNPLVAGADGRFGDAWFTTARIKLVLTDADGVVKKTVTQRYSHRNALTAVTGAAGVGVDDRASTRLFSTVQGLTDFSLNMGEINGKALGFVPGTITDDVVDDMNELAEDYAGERKIVIGADATAYQTTRPLVHKSGLDWRIDGTLENTNTGIVWDGPPIWFGVWHSAPTSPDWSAGTRIDLFPGDWNADGDFELDSTVGNDTMFAALAVGDYMLYNSDASTEFDLSGDTGLQRMIVMPLIVESKTAGTPNKIHFDRPGPRVFKAGSLCFNEDEDNLPPAVSATGQTAAWWQLPFGGSIKGSGSLNTGSLDFQYSGSYLFDADLYSHTGYYGAGSNTIIHGVQRFKYAKAQYKAFEFAASSAFSLFEVGVLVCDGDGDARPATGKFGENSRFCTARIDELLFPNNAHDTAIAFIRSNDCAYEGQYLDASVVAATSPVVLIGTVTTVTTADSGVNETSRNRFICGEVRCGTPLYFVQIETGGTTAEDNHVNGNFYGAPATAAVRDEGTRSVIRGYYQNGDIILAGVDADVDVRLGSGMVSGFTEATAKRVYVNGVRKFPGAYYPALADLDDAGTHTYTPDMSYGAVSEMVRVHRLVFSSASTTGITIAAPTNPVEGMQFVLVIVNKTGGSITPTLNATFVDGPSIVAVQDTRRSSLRFAYIGGRWIWDGIDEQDANISGPTVYTEDFASSDGWTLASGLSITAGKLVKTVAADATARTASATITGLRPGSTYATSFTISGRTAGSAILQLGGTSGTTRTADGTYTENIIAGSSGLVSVIFSGTVPANDLKVDDISVTEL